VRVAGERKLDAKLRRAIKAVWIVREKNVGHVAADERLDAGESLLALAAGTALALVVHADEIELRAFESDLRVLVAQELHAGLQIEISRFVFHTGVNFVVAVAAPGAKGCVQTANLLDAIGHRIAHAGDEVAGDDRKIGAGAEMNDPRVVQKWESGGGGMVSTIGDYARFAQMVLNGGKLDGKQYLKPETFEMMASDHVGPGSGVGRDFFYFPGDGFGFGLGFGVRTDPGNAKPPPAGSLGELKWDGASGCYFVIDRKQDMFFVLLEQTPSQRQPIQKAVKQLIYEAMEN